MTASTRLEPKDYAVLRFALSAYRPTCGSTACTRTRTAMLIKGQAIRGTRIHRRGSSSGRGPNHSSNTTRTAVKADMGNMPTPTATPIAAVTPQARGPPSPHRLADRRQPFSSLRRREPHRHRRRCRRTIGWRLAFQGCAGSHRLETASELLFDCQFQTRRERCARDPSLSRRRPQAIGSSPRANPEVDSL